MSVHMLDIRGEICPYPLVKTKEKLSELRPGDQLDILIDYPLALENISRWAENAGHKILKIEKVANSEWRLVIEKR